MPAAITSSFHTPAFKPTSTGYMPAPGQVIVSVQDILAHPRRSFPEFQIPTYYIKELPRLYTPHPFFVTKFEEEKGYGFCARESNRTSQPKEIFFHVGNGITLHHELKYQGSTGNIEIHCWNAAKFKKHFFEEHGGFRTLLPVPLKVNDRLAIFETTERIKSGKKELSAVRWMYWDQYLIIVAEKDQLRQKAERLSKDTPNRYLVGQQEWAGPSKANNQTKKFETPIQREYSTLAGGNDYAMLLKYLDDHRQEFALQNYHLFWCEITEAGLVACNPPPTE